MFLAPAYNPVLFSFLTEGGVSKSMEKQTKRRNPQFGENDSHEVWCSYCKQGIWNQMYRFIDFNLVENYYSQYFCLQ